MLLPKTNVILQIDYFANKSVRNFHTVLSLRIGELGIEEGIILKKIFALYIFENLEKQAS